MAVGQHWLPLERFPMLCILCNTLGTTLIVDEVLMLWEGFTLNVNPKLLVTLADGVLNNWTLTRVIRNSGIADSDARASTLSI